MDAAQIIKSLSPAQKAAVLKLDRFIGVRWSLGCFDGPYLGISARTLNALVAKGLVHGRENFSSRYAALLPLGLEVRAALA